MERRELLAELLIEDLRGNEPLLQKAALLRMRKMEYVDYALFLRKLLAEPSVADDPRIRTFALQLLKIKKEAAARPPAPEELAQFGAKTVEALLADWRTADVRLKLAILAQLDGCDAAGREALVAAALADGSPIVRLEAENARTVARPAADAVSLEALIAELRDTNPPRKLRKPLAEALALVVDDAKTIREILAGHLARHLTVHKADCAAAAEAAIAAHDYDLIFLDINLPDKDGLNLLAELRERGVTGNVITFSTLETPHVVQTAFINGANHYMVKNRMAELIKAGTLVDELRSLFVEPA